MCACLFANACKCMHDYCYHDLCVTMYIITFVCTPNVIIFDCAHQLVSGTGGKFNDLKQQRIASMYHV